MSYHTKETVFYSPDEGGFKSLPEKPINQTGFVVLYSSQTFPNLDRQMAEPNVPGSSKKAERNYARLFMSEPYSLDELISLEPSHISLASVLHRQRRMKYPSKEVKTVNVVKERVKRNIGLADHPADLTYSDVLGKTWYLSAYNGFTRQALDEVFAGEALDPDLSAGAPNGSPDNEVNTFLAFHLAKKSKFDDTPQPISSMQELVDFAAQNGEKFDPYMLKDGLDHLVATPIIEKLLQNGAITESDVPDFLKGASDILVDYAVFKNQQPEREINLFFPYSPKAALPQFDRNLMPSIHFLPYLMRSYLQLTQRIPEFVHRGEYYPDLQDKIKGLFNFVNMTLAYHLWNELGETSLDEEMNLLALYQKARVQNHEEARVVSEISNDIKAIGPEFVKVLNYYQDNPELLNRSRPQRDPEGVMITYREWLQVVRSSGARAPRKPTAIKFGHQVRKGEV